MAGIVADPNLWPRRKHDGAERRLRHYDVFISFSGRGTMKGIANALQNFVLTTYTNERRTLPSIFNENIESHIEDTITEALHATHAGVVVLLINQRYIEKKWPKAEAQVIVAMWLNDQRIQLLPVIVLPNNIQADANALWEGFVAAMSLKPKHAKKLERHKYIKLVATRCNTDCEEENAVEEEDLDLPNQDDYSNMKAQLLSFLRVEERPDAILGSDRRTVLMNILNSVGSSKDIMEQAMVAEQLGLPRSNLRGPNLLTEAYKQRKITETDVEKLLVICRQNNTMVDILKSYQRKFVELPVENPRGRFKDDDASRGDSISNLSLDGSGTLSINTTQSRPNTFAAIQSTSSHSQLSQSPNPSFSSQSPWSPRSVLSPKSVSSPVSLQRNMSSFSFLGIPTSGSGSLSPSTVASATIQGLYEKLNQNALIERLDVVEQATKNVERFGVCYIHGRSGAGKSIVVDSVVRSNGQSGRRTWIVDFGDTLHEYKYEWNDFIQSFTSAWTQECGNDENLPTSSDLNAFAKFIDRHIDILILDNLQRVETSSFIVKLGTLAEAIKDKEKKNGECCMILLISQSPPQGFLPKLEDCSVHVKGLSLSETLALFQKVKQRVPNEEELTCLRKVAKSVGGHISLLRHIICQFDFLMRLAKDPKFSRQLPTFSLQQLYDSMDNSNIKFFLMHVAVVRIRLPRQFFLLLANHLGMSDDIVDVIERWSWLSRIDTDATGRKSGYEEQAVYMNDFEREFLISKSVGSHSTYHFALAEVLYKRLRPEQIYDFARLTPQDYPFFPDSDRNSAERHLRDGNGDRIPGVTKFLALRELIYHMLSSCIQDSRTKEELLDYAKKASHFFLLVDFLLYQYGHRVESRKLNEILEEALRSREDLIHAQFWLRPIRDRVDNGEVEAAQKRLRTEFEKRYKDRDPAPILVEAIRMELEGRILTIGKQHDAAFVRHVQSVDMFRKAKNPKGESTAFILAARSAHECGRLSDEFEASPLLAEKAASLCQTTSFSNARFAWGNLLTAAEMHYNLGNEEDSIRCILQALHHMDLYLGGQTNLETALQTRTYREAKKIFSGHEGSVIFDCDGVLVDTEKIKFLAWKKVAKKRGFTLTHRKYFEKLVGLSFDETVSVLADEGVDEHAWKAETVKKEYLGHLHGLWEQEGTIKVHEEVVHAFRRIMQAKKTWWQSLTLAVVTTDNDTSLLIDNLQHAGIEQDDDLRIYCDSNPYSFLADESDEGPHLVVEDTIVGANKAILQRDGTKVVLISGDALSDHPRLQPSELRYKNGAGPYVLLAHLVGVTDESPLRDFPTVRMTPEMEQEIERLLSFSKSMG